MKRKTHSMANISSCHARPLEVWARIQCCWILLPGVEHLLICWNNSAAKKNRGRHDSKTDYEFLSRFLAFSKLNLVKILVSLSKNFGIPPMGLCKNKLRYDTWFVPHSPQIKISLTQEESPIKWPCRIALYPTHHSYKMTCAFHGQTGKHWTC